MSLFIFSKMLQNNTTLFSIVVSQQTNTQYMWQVQGHTLTMRIRHQGCIITVDSIMKYT